MGNRLPSSRHAIATRALAFSMALVAVVAIRPASSAPGELFSTAAPAVTDTPKAAGPITKNDASVATKTGAFNYSFPIAVPPGRHGVQPKLALSYSSQAGIYGTLAAGWTLSGIPIISEDTSQGRLYPASLGTKFYVSSMAGGRPLVPVFEGGASLSCATTREAMFNVDMKVADFVGKYRKASIKSELPGETLKMSVGEALQYDSTTKKLLLDKQFAK